MDGLKVDFYFLELGSDDFLASFFSTIGHNLEARNWGSRFPIVMNELYYGKLPFNRVKAALNELVVIKSELEGLHPRKIVWDFDNINRKPPWGHDISSDISSLGNYFVTSNGKDLFSVVFEAIKYSLELESDIEIFSL